MIIDKIIQPSGIVPPWIQDEFVILPIDIDEPEFVLPIEPHTMKVNINNCQAYLGVVTSADTLVK